VLLFGVYPYFCPVANLASDFHTLVQNLKIKARTSQRPARLISVTHRHSNHKIVCLAGRWLPADCTSKFTGQGEVEFGSMKPTIACVGLMNPGDRYRFTRHNAGAMALDALWPDVDYSAFKSLAADLAEVSDAEAKLLLVKPQTFMNLSGQAVGAVMKKFNIPIGRVVVFHDEVELDTGIVRYKFGGGHKGHNGLRSIMGVTGSADFHRIRVGVSRPANRDDGIADYLLSVQPAAQRVTADQLLPVWQELISRLLAN
jgi:PTH1 family peptidyl-tRNA hydrolase